MRIKCMVAIAVMGVVISWVAGGGSAHGALIIISPTTAATMPWGPTLVGMRLAASTDKPTYTGLEPIVITITAENVGNEVATFGVPNTDASVTYDIDVIGPDKAAAPWTAYGDGVHNDVQSYHSVSIQPGHAAVHSFVLNLRYDMTRPGDYTITAALHLHGVLRGVAFAHSLPIHVKVAGPTREGE